MKNGDLKINNEYYGLTKREYFAALAMQALVSAGSHQVKSTVKDAVFIADSLLTELEKPQP